MKRNIKNKWIKALRSGEYEQGDSTKTQNALCCIINKDPNHHYFSAYGVLANELTLLPSNEGKIGFSEQPDSDGDFAFYTNTPDGYVDNYHYFLPIYLLTKLGLTLKEITMIDALQEHNTPLNKIADWIEENL